VVSPLQVLDQDVLHLYAVDANFAGGLSVICVIMRIVCGEELKV
jgi:hypothetical protein